jgi:folate-binding protein YgfZ
MTSQSTWQSLLKPLSLAKTDTELTHTGIAIYPLDYQSAFKVVGPDSQAFLQGQLSCDLKEVNIHGSRLAAHCTPKGSMLSLMRVIKMSVDSYLIKTNSENLQNTIDNLNKYMMFSKAEAINISDQWLGFGLEGAKAEAFISEQCEQLCPTEINQTIITDDKIAIKVSPTRYEIWLKTAQVKQWLNEEDICQRINLSKYWLKQDITDAIPDIYPPNSSQFIPQMCNLQALHGISFNKGCYTGQEVITRLHFRGKLTKYLIIAKIERDLLQNDVTINDAVYSKEHKNVGKVLQSVDIEGVVYLQIIVNYKYSKEPLFFENDIAIQALPQPYELDVSLFTRKD